VDLNREFVFKHSRRRWRGVPIIVANMDTVGTFDMAVAFAKHNAMVAIHKHYSVEEWATFTEQHPEAVSFVAASAGTSERDLAKLDGDLHLSGSARGVLRASSLVHAPRMSYHTTHSRRCRMHLSHSRALP